MDEPLKFEDSCIHMLGCGRSLHPNPALQFKENQNSSRCHSFGSLIHPSAVQNNHGALGNVSSNCTYISYLDGFPSVLDSGVCLHFQLWGGH